MEIPDQIAKKARQFFLSFFQKLSDDMNTLVDAPVECTLTEVNLLRGEDDLGFLFDSEYSSSYALEDGLRSGSIHLLLDAPAAIALSGLMMMLPKAVVQKNVKSREYTEEIQEGFHEIANQIMGSLNTRVEEKMAGGHLFLDSVEHLGGGGALPTSLKVENTYLDIGMEIKVSDFRASPAHWLVSRSFANSLLKIEMPGTPEELAADAPKETAPPATPPPAPVRAPDDYEFDLSAAGVLARSTAESLPAPDEPGGIRVVMTLPPFLLNEAAPVSDAVDAMFPDGQRILGVESQGILVRVVSQGDVRKVMGAFYGSKAVTPQERALLSQAIGKLNERQRMVTIPARGSIDQAADLLKQNNLFALPVITDGGNLRGFVPAYSLLEYYRKKAG
ncbi:CBS domain-containing protein [Candidatus Magnetaquicoccus inordinatus]|uniref:CBS domain-containing protein n=1 Tax=Candidatus Magnetaquicoccus inordinatus TaxID=2496818 RepID=UPI00102AF628|nr:CBS domain-containing protein [Candidatus Magnetaquicoccus inordinatus]